MKTRVLKISLYVIGLMFTTFFLATIIGLTLGTITGLAPGVHVNMVAALILSSATFLLPHFSPLTLSIAIVAMAVTHTFLDTLPSTFLGASDGDATILLPGHRLLLQGKAYEAVALSLLGALGGLLLSLLLVPALLLIVHPLYNILKEWTGILLLSLSAFLIFREHRWTWALFVFLLSGTLGVLTLQLPLHQALFPLLSGLFGASSLILSFSQRVHIPPQTFENTKIENNPKVLACAVVIGWFASFLPGFGPAQAAVIGSQITKVTEKTYILLTGGLSTVNMVLSLVTFYSLEKARNGAIAAVLELFSPTFSEFILLLSIALISGSLACLLTLFLSRLFTKAITQVNYPIVCFLTLIFLCTLVFFLEGILGIIVFIISTFVGLIPPLKEIPRSHLMGCLLIPTILYFL